jgi:hypothetical protein
MGDVCSGKYNPNTEQENLNIMNEALKKSNGKNTK